LETLAQDILADPAALELFMRAVEPDDGVNP
jgi:hypothetical protein